MVRVTVGVPVYNGAGSILDSLQSLAAQDYGDFNVLISDNASTDGTSDICSDFAAKDPRFAHVRQSENLGAMPNFFWLLDQAQSPLFAWRAHDDWSSTDYLSRLVACFDADASASLAVGTVVTRSYRASGEPRIQRFPFPGPSGEPGIVGRYRQMYRERASWIYGLWNRDALVRISERIWSAYPDPWGFDHLCVAAAILRGGVRGDTEAEFTQHMDRRVRDHGTAVQTPKQMLDLRRRFGAVLAAEIDATGWNPVQHLAWKLLVPTFMDHRLDHRRRIYKTLFRQRFGPS